MAFASGLLFGQGTQAEESTEAAQNPVASSAEALAAAAQNPVAAMYSLPFQNNTYFGAGPNHDKTYDVLNIQPVLPFTVGDWNIISRTIAPLIYVPSVRSGLGTATLGDDTTAASAGPAGIPETFGLGDINQSFIFRRPHRASSSGASGRHLTCRQQPSASSALANSVSGLRRSGWSCRDPGFSLSWRVSSFQSPVRADAPTSTRPCCNLPSISTCRVAGT
jgi:hypothetical protein